MKTLSLREVVLPQWFETNYNLRSAKDASTGKHRMYEDLLSSDSLLLSSLKIFGHLWISKHLIRHIPQKYYQDRAVSSIC